MNHHLKKRDTEKCMNNVQVVSVYRLINKMISCQLEACKHNTVVISKIDYELKALEHLSDGPYELIDKKRESTELNKLKAEAAGLVKSWKPRLDGTIWFLLNPMSNSPS